MAHMSSDTASAATGRLEEADQENYIEAYGHKFHCSGNIYFPFDESEQKHMHARHRLLRLCLDGALTLTRLSPETKEILDIGTGTGAWAVEMAARYPGAKITGIDISRIQGSIVPENLTYLIADVEEPWTVEPESVDFVHIREVAGGIRDWQRLTEQAHCALRPEGLIEMTEIRSTIHDFDGKFADAEVCPAYSRLIRTLADKVGMDSDPAPKFPDWLHEAGFERVSQRTEILPVGDWAPDRKLRTRQKLVNEITKLYLGERLLY